MRELYALTTVFGSDPCNPAAAAFGFDAANRMINARFGNVAMREYPARLQITEPKDLFLALTSYLRVTAPTTLNLNDFVE